MKFSKIAKITSILFIVMAVLGAFSMVLGTTSPSIPGPSQPSGDGVNTLNNVVGGVIFVIQIIAFAAAVIMLIFLGIKFLTASPEGKAEVKKMSVIYIVGAVLLFAATGILQLIRNLAIGTVGNGQ